MKPSSWRMTDDFLSKHALTDTFPQSPTLLYLLKQDYQDAKCFQDHKTTWFVKPRNIFESRYSPTVLFHSIPDNVKEFFTEATKIDISFSKFTNLPEWIPQPRNHCTLEELDLGYTTCKITTFPKWTTLVKNLFVSLD